MLIKQNLHAKFIINLKQKTWDGIIFYFHLVLKIVQVKCKGLNLSKECKTSLSYCLVKNINNKSKWSFIQYKIKAKLQYKVIFLVILHVLDSKTIFPPPFYNKGVPLILELSIRQLGGRQLLSRLEPELQPQPAPTSPPPTISGP